MKIITKLFAVATIALLITTAGPSAFAQTNSPQIVTLDENGHGDFNGGPPLPFTVSPDPVQGIPTLQYNTAGVGVFFTPGDVVLQEPLSAGGGISDILRFGGSGNIWFFSDREPADVPPFDLADSPVMATPGAGGGPFGPVFLLEQGPEGQDGLSYTPTPGMPGYYPNSPTLTYNIISDVPEPGTWLLAGFASLLWFIKRWRWKAC
jgi:hypothetical protein